MNVTYNSLQIVSFTEFCSITSCIILIYIVSRLEKLLLFHMQSNNNYSLHHKIDLTENAMAVHAAQMEQF